MPCSVAPKFPPVVDDGRVLPKHRATLAQARSRAAPVVEQLAAAIRTAPDRDLDRLLPVAMRELDLLWQSLGRVTEP